MNSLKSVKTELKCVYKGFDFMKKLLVLFCLIIFSLPVFAEYRPIPANLSKQYKAEMESMIDKGYPKAIKNVDDYVKRASIYHKRIMKNGYFSNNQMDVINLGFLYENCLPTAELDLYADLMKVTQEKYLGVKYEPIGTDWVGPLEDFLNPYFRDNNVNTKKLVDIAKYESQQGKIVKNYLDEAESLRPND